MFQKVLFSLYILVSMHVIAQDLSDIELTSHQWGPRTASLGSARLSFYEDYSFKVFGGLGSDIVFVEGTFSIKGNRIRLVADSMEDEFPWDSEGAYLLQKETIWVFKADSSCFEKQYTLDLLNGSYTFWRDNSPVPKGQLVIVENTFKAVALDQEYQQLSNVSESRKGPGYEYELKNVHYLNESGDYERITSLPKGMEVQVLGRTQLPVGQESQYWYYCKVVNGHPDDPAIDYFWLPYMAFDY